MKIGLSLLVAALVLAAVALLAGNRVGSIPPTHVEASRDEPTSLTASASSGVRREEVASPAETATSPAAAAAEAGRPWLARMRVVDENREPVADAVITLWDGPTKGSAAERAEWRRTHPGFLELCSDHEGRALAMLERDGAIAVADKESVGRSADKPIERSFEGRELTFIVLVPIAIRGVVRHADGSPAAGATVSASTRLPGSELSWTLGITPPPPPTVTDAAGRFAMSVGRYARCELSASLGEKRTFVAEVWASTDEPPQIELVFPGAYALSGHVVDADGAPVPNGYANAWPVTEAERLRNVDRIFQRTDANGAFAMDLPRSGSYRIHAGATGHAASEVVFAEVSATQPSAQVRLVLQRHAEIRGHVVHGDGTAFADVGVDAAPELETASAFARVEASRFEDARTRSDAAGAFVLRVHPSTTWLVSAHPRSSDIHVQERRVAPGRADVVLTISDADLAGCIVRGTVAQPDGSPARDFAVEIVVYQDGKPVTYRDAKAVIDGDRFVCAPVPLHEAFGVQVIDAADREKWPKNSGPFAPALLGPLTAEAEQMEVMLRLQAWGQLPVRVLEADGRPVRGVQVWLEPDDNPNAVGSSAPVASDGNAMLPRVTPGSGTLRVARPIGEVAAQRVTVISGPNPEVVVRLPAR